MSNITLVNTYHEEKGNCNLQNLYKIIEVINPEVIFEELSPKDYNEIYVKNENSSRLEQDTIIEYLEKHSIEHIPVDCADVPPLILSYYKSCHKNVERRSIGYREFAKGFSEHICQYGYMYLNSNDFIEHDDWIENEIQETLKEIKNEKLIQNYQKWLDFMDIRENVMIEQIYDYCKDHIFERGLFYIGASHRAAIIKKTQKYNETAEVKLAWNYLEYKKLENS